MQEELDSYYGAICSEDTRLLRDRAHSVEYFTTIRTLDRLIPPGSTILDACAGTGPYAFYLAANGHFVTAGDLMQCHVDTMKIKQAEKPLLTEIFQGSILDLSRFPDASFDVVLNMGALYHMKSASDREAAVRESMRVLKPGGLFVAATIHRNANFLKYHSGMKGNIKPFLNLLRNGYDKEEDLFYSTTPEETEQLMSEAGLIKLEHIGTDGVGYFMQETLESLSQEEFDQWLAFHYESCGDPSLLGYSMHGLYVGRKPEDEGPQACCAKSDMEYVETGIPGFRIRSAVPEDIGLVLQFIRDLAEYEHLLDQVCADEAILRKTLFEQKAAEVVIGEYKGEPAGFVLFFHNYSTFLGRPGFYIEDLFVKPALRGLGLGKALLSHMAKLALDRNCKRLEWWCLDWNEPSIAFYRKLGAVPMDEWTVYRMTGEALEQLAGDSSCVKDQ